VIESIQFATVASGKTKWVDSNVVTAAQLAAVKSVRVSLTISDTINHVTRTFSNTYELRNRLL
jgi:type IV pilus assembly protein PilW